MSQRFAAFKHASYQRFFLSRFFSVFAVQILSTSVAWQMYDVTESAALLGWIGLVQFAPALLLVLVTGLASDKFGRRRMMGLSIFVQLCCAATVLVLAAAGQFSPIPVLCVLGVFGIARAFLAPATSSLVVNLVPTEDFPNAVAWNASSWQSATIVGPVAGGLLYGVSANLAYSVSCALMVLGVVLVLMIPKPDQKKSTDPTTLSILLGGFSYIWKEKVVLGAITLDLFAVLLGGAVALLPIYARDILDLGPSGLGLLRAAPGIGAILMVGIITSFPIRRHAGLIMFGCVVLFGLSTFIFGVSTLAWISIPALIMVGAFDMISVYVRGALIQLWTPDELRGRVSAANSVFIGASNELGEFRAGMMAAWLGAIPAVALGGAASVGIAAGWALMFPKLRKIQKLEAPDEKASGA